MRTPFEELVEQIEPRCRAIPIDEFGDGMLVHSLSLFEVRLLMTADFVCSRSGSARTRLGDFFLRRGLGILAASCAAASQNAP